jgi:hypothetical protein
MDVARGSTFIRRLGPLVSVLACAAGCQQLLGLDDYQAAGGDAGYDATLMASPEGAADTAAVDRATGGEAEGPDVTPGADADETDAEPDSVAADVASQADSSEAAGSSDDAPDSEDAGTSDVVHVADGSAEAADSAVDTCPQGTPPGATTCCGHTACIARQGNACNCGKCNQSHCASFCCFDSNGNLSCVASPAACN